MESIYLLLLFLLLLNSFFVFSSQNPVYSVLFLILVFCDSACLLIILNVEFLALLYIIIYVGAIAVLFLFVVMMLNVKNETAYSIFHYIYFFVLNFLFISILNFYLSKVFVFFKGNEYIRFTKDFFITNIDTFSNIVVFGQILYNYYLICFLLVGLLLFLSMIGAIVLTLHFKSNRKTEIVFKQLARSDNILSLVRQWC
jgi:NADH-quinone oxidoreductase subunit J